MKIRYTLFVICLFIVVTYSVYEVNAQEVGIFVYDASGNRDPFVPLVTESGELIVTYGVINSIKDVILEGILYDDKGESVVIMNGLVLKENDRVGKIKIKSIMYDRVVLLFEEEEHTFKLKE